MNNPTAFIELFHDDTPENPREWENICTMVCWHPRYTLGDVQINASDASIRGYMLEAIEDIEPNFPNELDEEENRRLHEDHEDPADVYDSLAERVYTKFNDLFYKQDLFLYDHSGITISTTPFNDSWDSGKVGFICVSKHKLRNEVGVIHLANVVRSLTKPGEPMPLYEFQAVEAIMESEVAVYDKYIRGEVYGYVVQEYDPETDPDRHYATELDSCWGFYGLDYFENGMLDNIDTELLQRVRFIVLPDGSKEDFSMYEIQKRKARERVPGHTLAAIDDWIEHGHPGGGFLRAILINDLTQAFNKADGTNIQAIREIVEYLYNYAPAECWGSQERYEAWMGKGLSAKRQSDKME